MNQYNIGDIVFVLEYLYKNGKKGNSHAFVIIDNERAIDINYFGFLLSSNIDKARYPYNIFIKKDRINRLNKDSIIKCDDLIQLENKNIIFKIGKVTNEQLNRCLDTYEKFLKEN